MIILIIHRLVEPCACAFLFVCCTLPSLAQGSQDSLLLLVANLHLQLLSIQWQNMSWPHCFGRGIGGLLSPFSPGPMEHCGRENHLGPKERRIFREKGSRNLLGAMIFPPNIQLASLLSASELRQVLVCPTCTGSVFPSRSHAHGVCIQENAFISPRRSWSGLGTPLQYQHVPLSRRGVCFAHRGVSVQGVLWRRWQRECP